MVICHSISIGEELTFVKYLRRVGEYLQTKPDDELAYELYDTYCNTNFDEIDNMVHISSVKVFFSEALKFSI